MIDLKAIRAAAEAATHGPWVAAGPSFGAPLPKYLDCVGFVNEDDEFDDVCTAPFGSDGGSSPDMNYIATANPASVIALLDRLEAQHEAIVKLREALGDVMKLNNGEPEFVHAFKVLNETGGY